MTTTNVTDSVTLVYHLTSHVLGHFRDNKQKLNRKQINWPWLRENTQNT